MINPQTQSITMAPAVQCPGLSTTALHGSRQGFAAAALMAGDGQCGMPSDTTPMDTPIPTLNSDHHRLLSEGGNFGAGVRDTSTLPDSTADKGKRVTTQRRAGEG